MENIAWRNREIARTERSLKARQGQGRQVTKQDKQDRKYLKNQKAARARARARNARRLAG